MLVERDRLRPAVNFLPPTGVSLVFLVLSRSSRRPNVSCELDVVHCYMNLVR